MYSKIDTPKKKSFSNKKKKKINKKNKLYNYFVSSKKIFN